MIIGVNHPIYQNRLRSLKLANRYNGAPSLSGMPREQLLKAMASFETIFAVGRTAIEARVLGCKIGVYDQRFPDASVWKVVDNRDAAKMLQDELNIIDKEKKLREADESYNPFRLAPAEFYN